jgi:hypothetical protein
VTGAHSRQVCSCAGSVCKEDIFYQGFVFCQLTLHQLDRINAHCSCVVILKMCFEVPIAIIINATVFWDVMMYSKVETQQS